MERVYNGVDLDDLATAPPGARTAIRREFGFSDDDFVAVQVARLHELKDHQTALRAVDLARQQCPQIRLLIVGDGDERAAIEQTIQDRDLHRNIILTGTRSDVSSLLAASDAFLLTSISEGIPLTVIEAMAVELPVVATRVGGLSEMIADGVSGYLCDAGDDAMIARRLERLAADSEWRSHLALAGNLTARQRFSLDQMLNSYRTIYDQMTGQQQH